MKASVKAVADIEVEQDADGGTVGAREDLAMRFEAVLATAGRVRFVDILTRERLTVREGGEVRFVGESEYIPCDKKGKCLDGVACAGCAFAELLRRAAAYEDALIGKGEITL